MSHCEVGVGEREGEGSNRRLDTIATQNKSGLWWFNPTCKILSTPKFSDMVVPRSKRPLRLTGVSTFENTSQLSTSCRMQKRPDSANEGEREREGEVRKTMGESGGGGGKSLALPVSWLWAHSQQACFLTYISVGADEKRKKRKREDRRRSNTCHQRNRTLLHGHKV